MSEDGYDNQQQFYVADALKQMADSIAQSLMLVQRASRQEAISIKRRMQGALYDNYTWTEERIKSTLEKSSLGGVDFSLAGKFEEAKTAMEEKMNLVLDTIKANCTSSQEILKCTVKNAVEESERQASSNSEDIRVLKERIKYLSEEARILDASMEKRIQDVMKNSLTESEWLTVAKSVEAASKVLEGKWSEVLRQHNASLEKIIQDAVREVRREIDHQATKHTETIKALEERMEEELEATRGHYASSEDKIQEAVRKALQESEERVVTRSMEETTKMVNEKIEEVSESFQSDYSSLEKKMQNYVQRSLRDVERRAVSKSTEEASKAVKTKMEESLKVVRNNYSTLEKKILENVSNILHETEDRVVAKSVEEGSKMLDEKVVGALSTMQCRNFIWQDIVQEELKRELQEHEERLLEKSVEKTTTVVEAKIDEVLHNHSEAEEKMKHYVQNVLREKEQWIVVRSVEEATKALEAKMEELFHEKEVSTKERKSRFLRRNMGRLVYEIIREFDQQTFVTKLEDATKSLRDLEGEIESLCCLVSTWSERVQKIEGRIEIEKTLQVTLNRMSPVTALIDKRLRNVEGHMITTNNRIIPTVSALLEVMNRKQPGIYDDIIAAHSEQLNRFSESRPTSSDSMPASSSSQSSSEQNTSKTNVPSNSTVPTPPSTSTSSDVAFKSPGYERGRRLMKAADSGDVELTEKIIDEGISVNFRNPEGRTPLHVAASNADASLMLALLARGADVSITTSLGSTPLHLAATYDHKNNCVDILLAAGSELDSVDKEKRTPLHLAAVTNNLSAAQSLIAAGAQKKVKDNQGRRPFDLARDSRLRTILRPEDQYRTIGTRDLAADIIS